MCALLNNIYYLNPCHNKFTNPYRDLQSNENVVIDENDIFIILEFVANGAIKEFIDDNSESSFPLQQLENMYIEKMHPGDAYS